MLVQIGQHRKAEGLVDLLLECHERIRTFSRLAEELGRRDDLSPEAVVDGTKRCERYFVQAFPLHVRDEEESVLPRLRGTRADVDAALDSMRAQHADHARQVTALIEGLRALRAQPRDGLCRERLHVAAAALAHALALHLAREEEVVFPAIRAVLSPEAQRLAIDELRARRR